MVLQPLLVPGLPPPLAATPFPQPHIPSVCNASLRTTFSHLLLGFPTDLVLWNSPLRIFWRRVLSSSILMIWPPPPPLSLLISVSFRMKVGALHVTACLTTLLVVRTVPRIATERVRGNELYGIWKGTVVVYVRNWGQTRKHTLRTVGVAGCRVTGRAAGSSLGTVQQ